VTNIGTLVVPSVVVNVKVIGGTSTLGVKLNTPELLESSDPDQVTSQTERTDVVTGGWVMTVLVMLTADVVFGAPLTVMVVTQLTS